MGLTNIFLDTYVAHKLSELTACSAPDLGNRGPWLNEFILRTAFHASYMADPRRVHVFNFLRRTEATVSYYLVARQALMEYVETPRNTVSPYFRSLVNWESCIAQCRQGYEFMEAAFHRKAYQQGDKSPHERLGRLHNDSKHMDGQIANRRLPTDATSGIWITNEGLECSAAQLTFREIGGLIGDMCDIADAVCRGSNSTAGV